MRVLAAILFAFGAALLSSSAAFASSPCDLATKSEVEWLLRGPIVPVPADQLGEKTAPYCLWATGDQQASIELTLWSAAELPVLGLSDAGAYFDQLREQMAARPLARVGERAFEAGFAMEEPPHNLGTIVVLKSGRVAVIDFIGVSPIGARAFSRMVAERL